MKSSAVRPGDLSWFIRDFNWDLLSSFLQTITLNGKSLTLEVWHEMCDDDIPLHTQNISSDIRLKELHFHLQDIARFQSVKWLRTTSIPSWKECLKTNIQLLPLDKQENRSHEIKLTENLIKEKISQCEAFVDGADIPVLIQSLQDELNDLNDRFRLLVM